MDRPIARSPWWQRRATLLSLAGVVALLLLYRVALSGGARTHRVRRPQVEIGRVVLRPFREAVSVPGTVQPANAIFLAATDGGRVEEILVAEGSEVAPGEILLRLANADLELDVQRREDDLQRALDALRTTRLEMEEARQAARREALDIEHALLVRRKDFAVQSELHAQQLTPYRDYERSRDEVAFWERRLALFQEAEERAEVFRATQIAQAEEAVGRRRRSFATASRRLDGLAVRAPVAGRLTALEVERGESKRPGERLGRIDAGGFKIEGEVDQIYVSRVEPGQRGLTEVGGAGAGAALPVRVGRVYAEVESGRFKIDLEFENGPPPSLKRGQRLTTRLHLGSETETPVLPKGPFFQRTGGRWVFVLAPDGATAGRREIRLGRQDVEGYEVLDGLEPGEEVILSRYDLYANAEKLILED